jgi:hypothetical protein
MLPQNQSAVIEKQVKEDKLTATEEVRYYESWLGFHLRANFQSKIFAPFTEIASFDKFDGCGLEIDPAQLGSGSVAEEIDSSVKANRVKHSKSAIEVAEEHGESGPCFFLGSGK